MEIEENWAYGVRTTGQHKKNNVKVKLFVEIKTAEHLHRLKQKVREMRKDEDFWIKQQSSRLEHVIRIGMLVGACVPYSSLKWCQKR